MIKYCWRSFFFILKMEMILIDESVPFFDLLRNRLSFAGQKGGGGGRENNKKGKSESNFKEDSSLAQSLGMNRENRVNITRIRNKKSQLNNGSSSRDEKRNVARQWVRESDGGIRTSILRVVRAGRAEGMENFLLAIVPVLKPKLTCKSLSFSSRRHNTRRPRRRLVQLDYSGGALLCLSLALLIWSIQEPFPISSPSWSNTTASSSENLHPGRVTKGNATHRLVK